MFIGWDIGGTKCAVIIGNINESNDWNIVSKKIFQTVPPAQKMIELLFAETEKLVQHHSGWDSIDGIGISCGGPLDSRNGIILSPPNLPGWDHIELVKMVTQQFKKPCLLQNDANACAVAEWKHGAGKGVENMIFLTFGTGMGAGLILDGKLYSGTNDLAGEVGHLRLAGMGPVGFGK
nr:ROK family protein [Chitinophagaceae bacterium]